MDSFTDRIRARLIRAVTDLAPGILAPLVALAWALPAGAQEPGVITGQVTNQNGQPVAQAQVYIPAENIGTLSRADGRYQIQRVPAGTHTLAVEIIGYRSQSVTVDVPPGGIVEQDFTLEQDLLNLEALVVTAARTPRTKLETAAAVTNLPEAEIELAQPRSTADLMKTVPGFYVESSGGEVGGNLFARGLPADGSFRYVTLMEDGMPVYDTPELFFVNADIFVRVDQNIANMEAVRGGASALYGSNAPGGLVNFISKTGGPEFAGDIKLEGATGGLARLDGNVRGPIAEDWRFSAGGFYRFDDGIRDPGFPASKGGQIKASLTHLFDRGHFRVRGKYMNDRNVFYLPLPLVNPNDPEFVQGFPDDGTLTSDAGNFLEVPLPTGEELELPLEDGQHQVGGSLQAELELDFEDGWTLTNTARVMSMQHQWNALLPFELVEAQDWAAGIRDDTPGGADFRLSFVETGGAFDTPNGLLSLGGLWRVDKPMTNFSNQTQVRKLLETASTTQNITLGTYFGHYTAGNTWYFNDVLTDVRNAPRFVDLEILDAGGDVIRQVTDLGFRRYLSNFVNGDANATLIAVYGGDDIQLTDRFRLELGARFEHQKMEQDVENTTSVDLGGPTDADDDLVWGSRGRSRVDVSFNEWAATVGANYEVRQGLNAYVRGSRGYKMPILDQYLFATDPDSEDFPRVAETLWQAEGGVKFGSPRLGFSAVGYWLQLSDFPSQDARVVDGETVFVTNFVGESRTIGLEFEAVSEPVERLRLNGTLTLQDPEYTEFVQGEEDLSGNQIRRIPQIISSLSAHYTLPQGLGVRGQWNFIGDRWSNNQNTVELNRYDYWSFRGEYQIPDQGVTLTATVQNAFGDDGLTEGNPRVDESLGAPLTRFLARPILPRRWVFGLKYSL